VWHKPNAMPESVRDRLNSRYELIFLLVRSPRYWFDLDPIRTPHANGPAHCSCVSRGVGSQVRHGTLPGGRRPGDGKHSGSRPGARVAGGSNHLLKYGPHTPEVIAARRYGNGRGGRRHPNGRNPGDVWSIPTRPYRGPHFAASPVDIPTRCIQAGCKRGGMVLDPFCGTGTTGLAALALGRRFTGIDLNPAFAELAAGRLREAADLVSGKGDRDGSTGWPDNSGRPGKDSGDGD
jgi:DNA methylase